MLSSSIGKYLGTPTCLFEILDALVVYWEVSRYSYLFV